MRSGALIVKARSSGSQPGVCAEGTGSQTRSSAPLSTAESQGGSLTRPGRGPARATPPPILRTNVVPKVEAGCLVEPRARVPVAQESVHLRAEACEGSELYRPRCPASKQRHLQ